MLRRATFVSLLTKLEWFESRFATYAEGTRPMV